MKTILVTTILVFSLILLGTMQPGQSSTVFIAAFKPGLSEGDIMARARGSGFRIIRFLPAAGLTVIETSNGLTSLRDDGDILLLLDGMGIQGCGRKERAAMFGLAP